MYGFKIFAGSNSHKKVLVISPEIIPSLHTNLTAIMIKFMSRIQTSSLEVRR